MIAVEVNCETGEETTRPLTAAEMADKQAADADYAAEQHASAARAAAAVDARAQLKVKAKTDPNLALVVRALGIDPNAG